MADIRLGTPVDAIITTAGEIVVATLDYAKTVRQTMSQENRDAFDRENIRAMKNWNDLVDGIKELGK